MPVLELDSPRWGELHHAYGLASDIPPLLGRISRLPLPDDNDPAWVDLWSSLAHQGDVYSASFAAVPHVIAALAKDPLVAPTTYFHFPAWVEICRRRAEEEIPPDLQGAYFAALARLPSLVAETYARPWDTEFVPVALAAVAAAKGSPVVAEAALELTPEVAAAMLGRLEELG